MTKEKIKIKESDIEEMCMLAEDVLQQLHMNFYHYDENGIDIFAKYDTFKNEKERKEESQRLMDMPESRLLYDLVRRGDDIGDVRYYTKEDIVPFVEPILPKALCMMRRGTAEGVGNTDFAADETVSDDYLIAVFAREVRNLMMIFAGQRMQKQYIRRYLLLIEAENCCRDENEWIGIYFDNNELKEAYEKANEILDSDDTCRKVAIYEFIPKSHNIEFDSKDWRQRIKKVDIQKLQCFRDGKKD